MTRRVAQAISELKRIYNAKREIKIAERALLRLYGEMTDKEWIEFREAKREIPGNESSYGETYQQISRV